MGKVIGSPARYIQGKGEMEKLYQWVSALGKSAFGIVTPSMLKRKGDSIRGGFDAAGFPLVLEEFGRECSQQEVDRLIARVKDDKAEVIIGIGGGKALDTAKAVAHFAALPVVVVPTIASTDAPCSALSVLYTPEGQFEKYLFLPKNPDVVLVDTEIVAGAPARLLIAGMGDALATYFEAKACHQSGATSMVGGTCSVSALALAEACLDTLLADGYKAKLAMESGTVSTAVDNIIEANTYLSGIGFESGGLAAAHAIHNGLTVLEETHQAYHGEKVAFGTLVQLVLENAPMEELEEILEFCKSVGLPTTLAGLGAKTITPDQVMEVAKAACAQGETIHNMPFPVTPADVASAIQVADKLGQ